MVYAAFYQLMVEPDKYIGKTLCIDGLYILDKTKKLEHTIIIAL